MCQKNFPRKTWNEEKFVSFYKESFILEKPVFLSPPLIIYNRQFADLYIDLNEKKVLFKATTLREYMRRLTYVASAVIEFPI